MIYAHVLNRGPAAVRSPADPDVSDLSEALKNPVLHYVRSQDSKAPSQREPRGNLLIFRSAPPVIPDTARGATLRTRSVHRVTWFKID